MDDDELISPALEDRLIRLRTFSKAYGMAGARIGYALATESNVRTFQKIRLHYGINRNAQIGALESLRDDEFRRYVVDATAQARQEYYRIARELGRRSIESRTNFVCIEMETPRHAVRVMEELLARGVWVRKPGAPPLDACIRVSAGTEPMRAAFADALRGALAEIPLNAMRYAIVSDIHTNLESLQCVLARLEPGDALVSLGDVVGYGPKPERVRGGVARSLRAGGIGKPRPRGGRKLRRRTFQSGGTQRDRVDARRSK